MCVDEGLSLSNPRDIYVSHIFPYHLNKMFADTTVRLFEQNYYMFPLVNHNLYYQRTQFKRFFIMIYLLSKIKLYCYMQNNVWRHTSVRRLEKQQLSYELGSWTLSWKWLIKLCKAEGKYGFSWSFFVGFITQSDLFHIAIIVLILSAIHCCKNTDYIVKLTVQYIEHLTNDAETVC